MEVFGRHLWSERTTRWLVGTYLVLFYGMIYAPTGWVPFNALGYPWSVIGFGATPVIVMTLGYPHVHARTDFDRPVTPGTAAKHLGVGYLCLIPGTIIAEAPLICLWTLVGYGADAFGSGVFAVLWVEVMLAPVTAVLIVVGIPVAMVVSQVWWRFIDERGGERAGYVDP